MSIRISFLTGTRADYGKLKPLMQKVQQLPNFESTILVTGMHLLEQYGLTVKQIELDDLGRIFLIPNSTSSQTMEASLARTIERLAEHLSQNPTDLLIVHGDRIEALAGAIVGALRNIPVAHIEGGEVSGTVDGLIRHSISKLSHLHFVSNYEAKQRLLQLGEDTRNIFVIGSPDVDILLSANLPSLEIVKARYGISFNEYAIAIFHPVTNEMETLREQVNNFCDALSKSENNYVIIKPNNDMGTELVQEGLSKLQDPNKYQHIPSMRFEYFLTLLRNASYIIGNSSAGVREAAYYGVPAINVGSRQRERHKNHLIIDSDPLSNEILEAISKSQFLLKTPVQGFGAGNSAELFGEIINESNFFPINTDKEFIDFMNKGEEK